MYAYMAYEYIHKCPVYGITKKFKIYESMYEYLHVTSSSYSYT